MPSAHLLRLQIETALANRIPSALTPAPRVVRPTAPTGIAALDDELGGGLPIGAITELAGPECSGRTSLALSFVAGLTQAARVCAWVDVSDALHPESAAAAGIDLDRLLWIRCGPAAEQLPLPGFAENPTEFAKKPAVDKRASPVPSALSPEPNYLVPRCSEPVPKVRHHSREAVPLQPATCHLSSALNSGWCPVPGSRSPVLRKPWSRLDQALRATDLLLQAGGFSAIVLDMGGIAPEFALRVPLATWFRYRASAERTHASVLLLTQHPCAKSSAGLVLHCQPSQTDPDSTTVFTGSEHRIEITRDRFSNVVDFTHKPPQSDHSILWNSRTPWSAPHPLSPSKAGRK
jgi:recombination protein RecA